MSFLIVQWNTSGSTLVVLISGASAGLLQPEQNHYTQILRQKAAAIVSNSVPATVLVPF